MWPEYCYYARPEGYNRYYVLCQTSEGKLFEQSNLTKQEAITIAKQKRREMGISVPVSNFDHATRKFTIH